MQFIAPLTNRLNTSSGVTGSTLSLIRRTLLINISSGLHSTCINDCRSNFSFMLPSEMIEIRKAEFEGKVNICNSLRYYFGL